MKNMTYDTKAYDQYPKDKEKLVAFLKRRPVPLISLYLLSQATGINRATLRGRFRLGWSFEKIINTPVKASTRYRNLKSKEWPYNIRLIDNS
jgi:hypothetical protein